MHIQLTAAGRKLKARAAKVPGCVLAASQCSIPELLQLTTAGPHPARAARRP